MPVPCYERDGELAGGGDQQAVGGVAMKGLGQERRGEGSTRRERRFPHAGLSEKAGANGRRRALVSLPDQFQLLLARRGGKIGIESRERQALTTGELEVTCIIDAKPVPPSERE